MPPITRTVRIGSAHGLHARPAKMFAQAAKDSGIPITDREGCGQRRSTPPASSASSRSAIEQGDYVTLTADGDDAETRARHAQPNCSPPTTTQRDHARG